MGSVFNRGTRDRPNWYGKFKDRDGTWRMVPTKQQTKAQARRWLEGREEYASHAEDLAARRRDLQSAINCALREQKARDHNRSQIRVMRYRYGSLAPLAIAQLALERTIKQRIKGVGK